MSDVPVLCNELWRFHAKITELNDYFFYNHLFAGHSAAIRVRTGNDSITPQINTTPIPLLQHKPITEPLKKCKYSAERPIQLYAVLNI